MAAFDDPKAVMIRTDVFGDALFTFGSASAGLPKVVHGGHLAAAVDGMLGRAAVQLTGAPMITANLEIDFLAPVPIDEEVVITVHVVSHVGRKCIMGALGQRDGKDFLKAKSLLLTPRQPAQPAQPADA